MTNIKDMMAVNKLLQNVDPNDLNAAIKQLEDGLKTNQGQMIKKKLQNMSKDELLQGIKGLNIPNDTYNQILDKLTKDPEAMKKVNGFLEQLVK